ncbi:MAG: hypothetical protein AB7F19_03720 [Candidatus Babeliales bacterium]
MIMYFKILFLALATFCLPLQAMRRATQQLLSSGHPVRTAVVAKHSAKPLAELKSQAPVRLLLGSKSYEHNESQSSSSTQYALPIGALAVGLAIAQDQTSADMPAGALAEEGDALPIDKVDITNMQAVLDVFQHGTQAHKQVIAQRMAQSITKYPVDVIVTALQLSDAKSHTILAQALASNITLFTLEQIAYLLKGDAQDETHEVIAIALNKQYKHFVSQRASVLSQATLKPEAVDQFTQAVDCLKPAYCAKATEQLAQHLGINRAIRTYNATQLFVYLKTCPIHIQKFIVTVYLKDRYNYNKGEMVKALHEHIEQERALVYQAISKEFQLTAQDWVAIEHAIEVHKQAFLRIDSSALQFIYLIDVRDDVKEAIAAICKKRGILEKIVVKREKDPTAIASVSVGHVANKLIYKLSLNAEWLRTATADSILATLEHELGGHMCSYHTIVQACISDYLYSQKSHSVDKVLKSASIQTYHKFAEYEADLASSIDDSSAAKTIAAHLQPNLRGSRPDPYLSNVDYYKALAAILYLKDAAHKWFDSEEAYNLYGPPAYDKFDYSKTETKD